MHKIIDRTKIRSLPTAVSALALTAALLATTISPSLARQGGHHPASYGHARHSQAMGGHHMRMSGGYARGAYGHGYRRGGYGPGLGYAGIGIGAGLAGLAAGAMLDDTVAADVADAGPDRSGHADAIAYCSERFQSYDPSSGTYLGYDGNEHACP